MRAAVLVSSLLLAGGGPAREVRYVFGTVAEIRATSLEEPGRALSDAFGRMSELESSLSIWDHRSEISRLNRAGETLLPPDAFHAVELALEIAGASGGAFDPTLEANGYLRVRLEPATRRVRLEPGSTLELGAIAKGCAVDLALASLRAAGASSALVDLGTSSIAVFGEEPVVFEVRNPGGGPPPAVFRMREGAVGSSSGDQRAGHVRDPKTGAEARSVAAVTVVAASAAEADALSTAVFVMGPEKGLALLEERGAGGLVLVEEGEGLVLRTTRGFAARYALEVAEGVRIVDSAAAPR